MKHNYPPTRKPTGPRPQAGRPKGEDLTRISISLPTAQVEWLDRAGLTRSSVIRRLISAAMAAADWVSKISLP
jgi:hypothetical protein